MWTALSFCCSVPLALQWSLFAQLSSSYFVSSLSCRERGGSPPRSRPGSRGRSRSRSVSPAAAGRGREPSRGRDPDSPHRGRTPERLRARAWADDRGRSRDRRWGPVCVCHWGGAYI